MRSFRVLVLTAVVGSCVLSAFVAQPVVASPPDVYASAVTISASQGSGSGFFISRTEIMTAEHVVEGSTSVTVTTWDGATEATGTVSHSNADCDIAIITVEGLTAPTLETVDAPAEVGEKVYAIGSPIGRPVMSTGEVTEIAPFTILTSVPVDFGSSGGALVNESGVVVGVVTRKDSDGNASAVPIGHALTCVEQTAATPQAQEPAATATDLGLLPLVVASLAFSLTALGLAIAAFATARRRRKPIVITLDPTNE